MSHLSKGSPGVKLLGGWYYRLIESYGYEHDGGDRGILWRMPMYFSAYGGQAGKQLDEDFAEFRRTRGSVSRSSLQNQTFLKCTSEGLAFIVRLLGGGELREASVADLSLWWTGRWAVTVGAERDDGWLEQSESGFLVTNIGEYSTALFCGRSTGMLVGPEHKRSGVHVFVWMGDVSKSGVLDLVVNHVPSEARQRTRNAASVFRT